MKSYLFTTDNDRGGVMLCDIDDFDEAVEYLCERFDGVVKVEAGEEVWQLQASVPAVSVATATEPTTTPSQQAASAEPDLFA